MNRKLLAFGLCHLRQPVHGRHGVRTRQHRGDSPAARSDRDVACQPDDGAEAEEERTDPAGDRLTLLGISYALNLESGRFAAACRTSFDELIRSQVAE